MPKKTPMRLCTGCGEMKPKSELIRIVKTPEGDVVLDKTGRTNGRGAYICKDAQCLKKAEKSKRMDRNLEIKIPSEVYESLEKGLLDIE